MSHASSTHVFYRCLSKNQPAWTNTTGHTPASVRLAATCVSSASRRKAPSSATRPASTRKAAPTLVTYAGKPSKVGHPGSLARLLHGSRFSLWLGHVILPLVSASASEGTTSCPSASPQGREEVRVYRLRLQVHTTGRPTGAVNKDGRRVSHCAKTKPK